MRVPLALLALALALPAQAQAQAQDSLPKNPGKEPLAIPPAEGEAAAGALPDRAAADAALPPLMDRIESRVAMPPASSPLTGYARFYSWADSARTKVTAVYLLGGAPGRKWIGFGDLPMPVEAGCAFVSLVYDAPSGRVEEIGCAPR